MSEIIEVNRPHIIPATDLTVQELMQYPMEEIMRYEWYYDIPGYEDHYQCNNFGKVYSIKRGHHLSPSYIKKENRYRVSLYKKGICSGFHIARVVALTFYGLPSNNKNNALHWDGDASNDRLDNIYWGSYLDNEKDKRRHGRIMEGEKHHMAILTESDVLNIRKLCEEDVLTYQEIANMYKVTKQTIVGINTGKSWSHI